MTPQLERDYSLLQKEEAEMARTAAKPEIRLRLQQLS